MLGGSGDDRPLRLPLPGQCRGVLDSLDARGPQAAWTLTSGVLGGLYFPIWFLPHDAALALIIATPFPSVIQLPLDVLVERGPLSEQAILLAVQAGWVVAMLALCRWVERRGERKLVVQGG